MSMSTHVCGFVPPDERWHAMKAVWDACHVAGTSVPQEVLDFFGYDDGGRPDEAGREVEITAREWKDEFSSGYEVTVADLPPDVKIVRFYNSW